MPLEETKIEFHPDTPESDNRDNVTYDVSQISEQKKKKKKFRCPYIFMNGFLSGIALIIVLCFSGLMIAIYPTNTTNNTYFFNIITFIIGVFAGILKQKFENKK